MNKDLSLREQARDALIRALAATGPDRTRLFDEAARLHQLAIDEEARQSSPDPPKEEGP
jgi:hypothetical protein